ncbi:MAG: glucose dehydrogenase [Thermoproteota archaeon]|nr:glucose dehydrogenase [Thermoproteota archaeon]
MNKINVNKEFYQIRSQLISHSLALTAFLLVSGLLLSGVVGPLLFLSTHRAFAQGLVAPPEPLVMGQINSGPQPSGDIFNLPPGYKIEPVLWNLTLPSTVTFDDNGTMYVAESGYSYGEFKPIPRILKVDLLHNRTAVLVDRGLNGPITDIEFNKYNGVLYVSHRGIISAVDLRGHIKDLIVGLPSMGDHHNNQIAIGPGGRFYFGQGTVTNTGVAGEDSYTYGWLKTSPELHDIPCADITLSGQNFNSSNPLTPQNITDVATTGAFVPFNNTTTNGQVIKGDVKCSGSIISSNANGTDLRVVAWGLRNPYGVALTDDGKKLIVANNGADERGSRRVGNDTDKIYSIDLSNSSTMKYLGWPDYFGNGEPVTDNKFVSESARSDNNPLQFLLQSHPHVDEKPLTLLDEGVAVTQVAVSNSTSFGFKGNAFITEFGTMAPLIHPFAQITQPMPGIEPGIIGQKVVMLDPNTGNHTDFLSLKDIDKTFRPVGVKFDLKGDALYVVSIGKTEVRSNVPVSNLTSSGLYPFATVHAMPWPYANTGVVWKIIRDTGATTTNQEQ